MFIRISNLLNDVLQLTQGLDSGVQPIPLRRSL